MTLLVRSPLTADERIRRRRLILADVLALVTLFLITALLAVFTNYLYQSYAYHQEVLSRRWLARGEMALQNGNALGAIDALRSALAYTPDQPHIQIELAEALAAAGRLQEASAYFNVLLENRPGDGMINLQLARLAARQGNIAQALDDYQRSIYGTWEGDGVVRRREVRLEFIDFLIASHRYDRARNELLVAAGNAPIEDVRTQLEIARKMEEAQDPADALRLYQTALHAHPSSLQALEGAGHAAFKMGRYLLAKQHLDRALNGPAARLASDRERDELRQSNRLLLLYPSSQLSLRARIQRILMDRKIAQARLAECVASQGPAQQNPAAPQSPAPSAAAEKPAVPPPSPSPSQRSSIANPLKSLASRFARHPASEAADTIQAPSPPDPLPALVAQWREQPTKISLTSLEKDPALAQAQLQLIYQTEKVTQQVCGAPTGDDALLLMIADAPDAVEQQ